jgi:hypothetical protein
MTKRKIEIPLERLNAYLDSPYIDAGAQLELGHVAQHLGLVNEMDEFQGTVDDLRAYVATLSPELAAERLGDLETCPW